MPLPVELAGVGGGAVPDGLPCGAFKVDVFGEDGVGLGLVPVHDLRKGAEGVGVADLPRAGGVYFEVAARGGVEVELHSVALSAREASGGGSRFGVFIDGAAGGDEGYEEFRPGLLREDEQPPRTVGAHRRGKGQRGGRIAVRDFCYLAVREGYNCRAPYGRRPVGRADDNVVDGALAGVLERKDQHGEKVLILELHRERAVSGNGRGLGSPHKILLPDMVARRAAGLLHVLEFEAHLALRDALAGIVGEEIVGARGERHFTSTIGREGGRCGGRRRVVQFVVDFGRAVLHGGDADVVGGLPQDGAAVVADGCARRGRVAVGGGGVVGGEAYGDERCVAGVGGGVIGVGGREVVAGDAVGACGGEEEQRYGGAAQGDAVYAVFHGVVYFKCFHIVCFLRVYHGVGSHGVAVPLAAYPRSVRTVMTSTAGGV